MEFSNRLRELLFHRRMTQAQLARAVNVAQPTVSKWIRQEVMPSIGVAMKIADALETSVDYLFGRTDDPSPPGEEHFNPVDPNWRDNPNCPRLLKTLSDDPDFDEYIKNPMARSILTGIAYNRGEPNKGFLLKFLEYALFIEEREARKRGG